MTDRIDKVSPATTTPHAADPRLQRVDGARRAPAAKEIVPDEPSSEGKDARFPESVEDFLIQSMSLSSLTEVGEITLSTLESMGLKGAIQIRGDARSTLSNIGPLSGLEESLLGQATASAVLDGAARYILGGEHLALLVLNMLHPSHPSYRSLEDELQTIFEIACLRAEYLQLAQWPAENTARAPKTRQNVFQLTRHRDLAGSANEGLEAHCQQHLDKVIYDLELLSMSIETAPEEREKFMEYARQCRQIRAGLGS